MQAWWIETDGLEFFVMAQDAAHAGPIPVAGPYQDSGRAWQIAEQLACRKSQAARYTALPDWACPGDGHRRRAAWVCR